MFKFPFNKKVQKERELLEEVKNSLTYQKTFYCKCGSRLRITTEVKRDEGPSNFEGFHTPDSVTKYQIHPQNIGHSIVKPSLLNWHGLVEERGWEIDINGEVKCPACMRGLTVAEYQRRKINGTL